MYSEFLFTTIHNLSIKIVRQNFIVKTIIWKSTRK